MGKANESGIGDRIRAARERLGWSREELAVHSGISWSAIAQAESGRRRNLRPGTLSSLSSALGVPIDYLVNGGPTPSMLIHHALFYDNDEDFADAAGGFLLEGIKRSEPALAITRKGNLRLLTERLGPDADGVELLDSKDSYRTPEAMLDLFRSFLDRSLREGSHWVRILGEPIWKGRSAAEVRLWTKYESLVNLVLGDSPTWILCPYDVRDVDPAIVADARTTHPGLLSGGKLANSSEYRDPVAFALEP